MRAKARIAVALAIAAIALSACSGSTRTRVLRVFFDGVPDPASAPVVTSTAGAAAGRPLTRGSLHGPYAAKLCQGCHLSAASSTLVAPKDELCVRCHQMALDKKYVHGPLAGGGCLFCHDPHSSPNPYLLVGTSGSFCARCHEPASLRPVPGHDGAQECTVCHDPHMSNRRFLLRD